MGTICPFCNIESDDNSIEFEDGCCPECGSIATMPSLENDDDSPAVFEEDEELFDNIESEEDEEDF